MNFGFLMFPQVTAKYSIPINLQVYHLYVHFLSFYATSIEAIVLLFRSVIHNSIFILDFQFMNNKKRYALQQSQYC